MKFRLLPYYFKKIGLALFLLTFWPAFVDGFMRGYIDEANGPLDPAPQHIEPLQEFTFMGIHFFSESFFQITIILSWVGLIIYALSKDKVFDELLQKLRFESIRFTFFLSVFWVLIGIISSGGIGISASELMQLQVIIFLITYKVKKVKIKYSGVKTYE